MTRKRLRRVLPVRVTTQDASDLRRWARVESDGNVSEVIRNMFEERRRRERESEMIRKSFGEST